MLRIYRLLITASAIATLTSLTAPHTSWAQSTGGATNLVQQSFPTQLFEPVIGRKDIFFTVEEAQVADHLGFGVSLLFNYQHKPLVIFVDRKDGVIVGGFDLDNATEIDVVRNQMTVDIGGVFGFHYKWLRTQIGVMLPINLLMLGNQVDLLGQPSGDLSATGIGDLRLQLKAQLFRELKGFSLAFSPIVTFPTGRDGKFGGEPNLSFRPRIVADYRHGKFTAAANLGWLVREKTLFFSSDVGHQFVYGVGAGYQVHRRVTVMGELSGRAGFFSKSGCTVENGQIVCKDTSSNDLDAFPLEADLGARFHLNRGFEVVAGGGTSLIKAIGSPQFRLIGGLRWSPDLRDTDRDGVYDDEDKCPTEPEDRDNWKDDDGCPEPDNDQDLIPDATDKCPNEAEDKDTFEDEDGCPDPDNDSDGISDINDSCPFEPESKDGFKDEDGCPDVPDRDNDGVADASDKCPDDAEDVDTFEDADGCPDPDNDEDGVPDNLDECPLKAEDIDNFEDEDGCPDPDNDKDGVVDAKDKCPDKAEVINGFQDEDGCPDKGTSSVIVEQDRIVITKTIYFATAKATIQSRSFGLLTEVALTLMVNPQIKAVRIEGHTDDRGNAAFNKKLSQDRADAVREFLIKKGVDPKRLYAVGFGSEKPIDDNKTRKGRAANRRVDFIILEQAPVQPQE